MKCVESVFPSPRPNRREETLLSGRTYTCLHATENKKRAHDHKGARATPETQQLTTAKPLLL